MNLIKTSYGWLDITTGIEYVTENEYYYYTKGDANAKADDGYRVDSDIEGVLNFNVKYIGYPTLWLRDIFK